MKEKKEACKKERQKAGGLFRKVILLIYLILQLFCALCDSFVSRVYFSVQDDNDDINDVIFINNDVNHVIVTNVSKDVNDDIDANYDVCKDDQKRLWSKKPTCFLN